MPSIWGYCWEILRDALTLAIGGRGQTWETILVTGASAFVGWAKGALVHYREGGWRAVVKRTGIAGDILKCVGAGFLVLVTINLFRAAYQHERAALTKPVQAAHAEKDKRIADLEIENSQLQRQVTSLMLRPPPSVEPLSRERLATMRRHLSAAKGASVVIAVHAVDPGIRRLADDIAQAFSQSGWGRGGTGGVAPRELRPGEYEDQGIRIFADEPNRPEVSAVQRALEDAELPYRLHRTCHQGSAITLQIGESWTRP